MGYAPVLALQKLFEQTGTTPSDIDTIELNEAFASQVVAVVRDAGLDAEKVNPYGGAIALGHPVGATGAILSVRVAKDLVRRDLELGIVTMCIRAGDDEKSAQLLQRLESLLGLCDDALNEFGDRRQVVQHPDYLARGQHPGGSVALDQARAEQHGGVGGHHHL